MPNTSFQEQYYKIGKVVSPVKISARALLTDEVILVQEETLETFFTNEEFSHLEARIQQEGISFDNAVVEFIENDLNNHEDSRAILSELSRRHPQVGPVVADVELNGTITFEPKA